MKQKMINPIGQIKVVKSGFSWTTFFFGSLVPLCRGDIKYFLIFLVASVFTFGFSSFVLCFFYNNLYINDLLEKGYVFENKLNKSTENQISEIVDVTPSTNQTDSPTL